MANSERMPWQPLRCLIRPEGQAFWAHLRNELACGYFEASAKASEHMGLAVRAVDTFLCDLTTGALDTDHHA